MLRRATAGGVFRWAFLLCAGLSLWPLWSVEYPPMVDLPQHAAQVRIWQSYDDPALGFEDRYALRFVSPYLAGYAVSRVFAAAMPIPAAMKAVVSLALLGLPLSLLFLATRTGSARWASLLGFPLGYCFAFHWGFLNYLLAVPVGLVFVAVGLTRALEGSRRWHWGLALGALVLYACHALVFGVAVAVVGAHVLAARVPWQKKLQALGPLAVPCLVIGTWILWIRRTDAMTTTALLWSEPPWERLAALPSMLLGGGQRWEAWWLGGLACLALPWLLGRPRRDRALPVAVAVALYFLMPNRMLGTFFVYQRLAVFIPLLALAAVGEEPSTRRSRIGRVLVVVFVAVWAAFLTGQFATIDREARDFDRVTATVRPDDSVLGLMFDPGTELGTGLPVFGHWVAWLEATRGSRTEFSFASSFPQIARYRPGRGPWSDPALLTRPASFEWSRDGHFDVYLVRSHEDRGPGFAQRVPGPVEVVARSGSWWLYRLGPVHPDGGTDPPT